MNETEINDLKTKVSNIPTTQKASQSEVNDGTNNNKFITPNTYHNSDIMKSIIDDDLYEKYEAEVIASNNQNGNVEWKQPQDFNVDLSGFYPCSKVVEIPLSTTSTEISIYPNQDELGDLRLDRPWMEDRMICMLFQMVVKKGNLLSYPTNAHFGSVSTSFTPIQKLMRYDDYYFYINKHKLSQNPTDELTKIRFTGMRVQNNARIFCNFQFAVLPLTASDFTKEIYDVRFYNKIIKAQQTKINNLETELSTIKLSYVPMYFYAHLAHNNELVVKFSNDPKHDVTYTHSGFEINTNNNSNLRFKESGLYHISYLDGYNTSSTESLWFEFANTGLDIKDKNSVIDFPINNTNSQWEKFCKSITVPVKKDAELRVQLSGGILDGEDFSRIAITRVVGFPNDII